MSATASSPSPALSTPATLRLDARRKLLPVEWFAVLYGLRVRDALDLIDDGTLYPAFNLALRAGGRRRKVHVWRGIAESYSPDRVAPKPDPAKIIAAVLPPLGVAPAATVTIRGSELCYRWCCSFPRIMTLVRAGELREVGEHGLNSPPRISYTSAAQWLERRVI